MTEYSISLPFASPRSWKRKGRLIAVGDIHGCLWEFETLVNHLNPRQEDLLVLLGDLINHGPDSHGVIRRAVEAGAVALLGNHELRLLQIRFHGRSTGIRRGDFETIRRLSPADWDYLKRMRLFLHLPEENLVLVHGGFLPGRPWHTQPASVVTRIQVVDARGKPRRRAESRGSPHWSRVWEGPPFVIYGHTPRPRVEFQIASLGLDTACVSGGRLSALILPEGKIVQVAARKAYC